MTEFPYTTAHLATELGVSRKTIRKRAAALGIGIDMEGRAGYRYSSAERQRLIDAARPVQKSAPRKKKRAA